MSPKELRREEEQRIYDVKTYILNHFHEQFTIAQLSRMAALGEQKFTDGFYRLFEVHAGAFIQSTRMNTGKFLIQHTDKSMKEIAALCGYSKARNFSSAYKKFFGRRPSEEKIYRSISTKE